MSKRNDMLQALCRSYLRKLRRVGKKHGFDVDGLIKRNRQRECVATEHEVQLLSRAVDDERLSRLEVPQVLGKSYRKAVEEGDFDNPKLKKLKHVGTYSKVSTLLLKAQQKNV